jgi:hypothetical protein
VRKLSLSAPNHSLRRGKPREAGRNIWLSNTFLGELHSDAAYFLHHRARGERTVNGRFAWKGQNIYVKHQDICEVHESKRAEGYYSVNLGKLKLSEVHSREVQRSCRDMMLPH